MMTALYTLLGVIAWIAFGFLGSGFLWKLIVAKHDGPIPGPVLAFATFFWPAAWLIGLLMWVGFNGIEICSHFSSGFIKWTGRPLLRKQTKDISA